MSELKRNGRKVGKLRFKGRGWFKTLNFKSGFKLERGKLVLSQSQTSKLKAIPLIALLSLSVLTAQGSARSETFTDSEFTHPSITLEGAEVVDGSVRVKIIPEVWTQTSRPDFTQWVENENVVALDRGEVRLRATGDRWVGLENSPFSSSYALATAGAGENIYIIAGSSGEMRFARYNSEVGWQEFNAGIPFPEGLRGYVRNGVAMVWDGEDRIYVLGGSGYFSDQSRYRDFYRYSISEDSWEGLADTPSWQGAGDTMTLVVDNSGKKFIYALMGCYPEGYRGNLSEPGLKGKTEFWRFDLQKLEWDERLRMHGFGADDGSSLAWASDNIYHLPGAYEEGLDPWEKRYLMRYSIGKKSWERKAFAPGGIDDGGSMVWDGGDYLYVIKGGDGSSGQAMAKDFWRYSISSNSWEILANLPEGVGDKNGSRLAFAGERFTSGAALDQRDF